MFSKKEEWNLLKREKNVFKGKYLIWHMALGEMVKKQGRARFLYFM